MTALQQLRAKVVAGDSDALLVLHDAIRELGPLPCRYLDGDHESVWAELAELDVQDAGLAPQARAVAWETMWRVRCNLRTVLARLRRKKYRFKVRRPWVKPTKKSAALLGKLERRVAGPLPLSLRTFWEVVGSVDFRQHDEQMRHDWFEESDGDLDQLGDHDPLYVSPVVDALCDVDEERADCGDEWEGPHYVFLAPDHYHKANVSGGANYHLYLPDGSADFRIVWDSAPLAEMIETERGEWTGQYFVAHLRRSLEGGGFRGRLDMQGEAWMPRLALQQALARDLLPI